VKAVQEVNTELENLNAENKILKSEIKNIINLTHENNLLWEKQQKMMEAQIRENKEMARLIADLKEKIESLSKK